MKITSKLLIMLLLILVILISILIQCERNNEYNDTTSNENTTDLNNSDFTDITSVTESESNTELESNTESVDEEIETTEELINFEGLTTDFSFLERVYTFNEKNYNTTMPDMVKLFLYDVLDDVKQEQEDLSFQILEYQNLQVFFSTIVDGVGPQSYEPKKSDTFLEFSANVDVRYKGYISSLNYSENGTDEFYSISMKEWVLIKEQSYYYYLYPYGYYYSMHK
jgi:hypothetical protein